MATTLAQTRTRPSRVLAPQPPRQSGGAHERRTMPRPKVADDQRRSREVAILLNGPESRAVREGAKRRSMRVSAFARQATLAAAAADATPDAGEESRQLEPDPGAVALRREIRRLSSILNQAVRLAHQGGSPDLQAAVEDLRAAVEKVLAR